LLVEFIGQIGRMYRSCWPWEFLAGPERNNKCQFIQLESSIFPIPGELKGSNIFNFSFPRVPLTHESYDGIDVRVRYFIQFTCSRLLAADIKARKEVWVQLYQDPPEINPPIKLEVFPRACSWNYISRLV
jgi:vacuolar protein sorting-associated protein 26